MSVADVLDTWEAGFPLEPVARALTLLNAAQPIETLESLSRVPIGKRDRDLLTMRGSLFGDHIAAVAACPRCEAELQFDLAVTDLLGADVTDVTDDPTFEVQAGDRKVRCRLPDSVALHAAAVAPSGRAAQAILETCIVSMEPSGRVDDLSEADQQLIGETMAELDPGADLTIEVHCDSCEAPFDTALAPDALLFSEIDTWARRTLREVHVLARHYGWSEGEILALTPHRRRCYLEAVDA